MKFPDYSGSFAGNNGAGGGQSKSNMLEVLSTPFLSASGPGFHTYKKDGTTAIILDAPEGDDPYIWSLVARRYNTESFPTLARPGSAAGRKIAAVGAKFVEAVNVGGGKIGAIVTVGAPPLKTPVLVDPTIPSGPHAMETFHAATEIWGEKERLTQIRGVFASGWEEGHRWGVVEVFHDPARILQPVLRRYSYVSSYHSYIWTNTYTVMFQGKPDTWSVFYRVIDSFEVTVTEYVTSELVPTNRFVVSVWAGTTENLHKVTVYDSDWQGRGAPTEFVASDVYCLGPGKLVIAMTPGTAELRAIPGTHKEGFWVSGQQFGDSDSVGSIGIIPDGAEGPPPSVGPTYTVIPPHTDYYDSNPPAFLCFSEDHGESWTTHTHTQGFFGLTDEELATTFGSNKFYFHYVGEGVSLAFVGITFSDRAPTYLYRIEGGVATRVLWPGDAGGGHAAVKSVGVGALICVDAEGFLLFTGDFGATWTRSKTPLADGILHLDVERPFIAAKSAALGKPASKGSKGSFLVFIPEPAPVAPTASPDSKKPPPPGIICLAIDSDLAGYRFRGRVPVAGDGHDVVWDTSLVGYYGLPRHRTDPRPEFRGEFDKPKKKKAPA